MAARQNIKVCRRCNKYRKILTIDQNTLESNASYKIQKHFEIIDGQIRGYACLALENQSICVRNKCLNCPLGSSIHRLALLAFSSDHVLPEGTNTGKKNNNQHGIDAMHNMYA